MSIFDFITDEEFRNSLESDYKEMNRCFESEAWKAVHVLAGSITEAVLIDYLVSQGIIDRGTALSLDLGGSIKLCGDNGIISRRSVDLSSVIKEYRNLIHPGRQIRLNEEVSPESARVALAVVQILIGEVSRQKRKNYGYTAEQIVAKLERDPSAKAIVQHLLKETRNEEIERMMTKVLPQRYIEIIENEYSPGDALPSFETCFRKSFDYIDAKTKKKITKWLVSVLKEKDEADVLTYATAFMRASDMKYMRKDNIALMKEHLLSRLEENISGDLLLAIEGIGGFLEKKEVTRFIDPLMRLACSNLELSNMAKVAIEKEHNYTSSELDTSIVKRIKAWEDMYNNKELSQKANIAEKLKNIYDAPF